MWFIIFFVVFKYRSWYYTLPYSYIEPLKSLCCTLNSFLLFLFLWYAIPPWFGLLKYPPFIRMFTQPPFGLLFLVLPWPWLFILGFSPYPWLPWLLLFIYFQSLFLYVLSTIFALSPLFIYSLLYLSLLLRSISMSTYSFFFLYQLSCRKTRCESSWPSVVLNEFS